jgi:glycosyltransferase involved in cell wall biosynthesis
LSDTFEPSIRGIARLALHDMKILVLLNGIDPLLGGLASAPVHSILALHRSGLDLTVAIPVNPEIERRAAKYLETLAREGVRVERFRILRFPAAVARRWGLCPSLVPWIRIHAREHHVIHCHGGWSFPSVVGAWAARRAELPCVLNPHEAFTSHDLAYAGTWFTRFLKPWVRRLLVTCVTRLVACSELEARDSAMGARHGVWSVVPIPVANESPRIGWGEASEARAFTVGYLGRLHEKKNVDELLRAIALLPEDFQLTIAGDGPEAERLEALSRQLGIIRRVRRVGFLAPERREEFLASLDVLVMPSRYEGFGIAALEAMFSRVPVIVSPTCGVAEILLRHDAGLIVEPSADRLAAAISELRADPPGRAQLAERGYQAADREASFAVYAARMRAIYQDVISSR